MTPTHLAYLVALYLAIPALGFLAIAIVSAYAIEHGWLDREPVRRPMAVKR